MSGLFDPRRFIEAEEAARASKSQATAADHASCDSSATARNPAEISHFPAPDAPTIAGIATIAACEAENLPWSSALARLEGMPCPEGLSAASWDEIVHEARALSRRWGAQAHGLGWTVYDLFGCAPTFSARRLDHNGLVMAIVALADPFNIDMLDARVAVLGDRRGNRLTYRRKGLTGPRLIWEAPEP